MPPVVVDTNVVLDMFVFGDGRALRLKSALQAGELRWLATAAMREELALVLAYPHIAARVQQDVLAHYDRHAQQVEEAPPAPVRCKDPDDQKFIDLAVAHAALLVSKDHEVLKLKNRMLKLGCPPVTPAY